MVKQKEKLTWQEYMTESALKKDKTLPEWFEGIVKNISSCRVATHVGKFTNPDVKACILVNYESNMTNLGYVTTQNTMCRADIVAPAQYIGSANLLHYDFDDTKDIMQAVEECPAAVQKGLEELSLPADGLKKAVTELKEAGTKPPEKSDGLLKQVYFPVDDGRYHLLSVMPSSSLLIELRKRIRQMNGRKIESYDKSSPHYGADCNEVTGLTVIGFGGTKPQNISALNFKQNGKAYLLPSMPPGLQGKVQRMPKRDYFSELLWGKRKTELLGLLCKYMKLDRNNLAIRRKVEEVTDELIEYVLSGVYWLRLNPPHWTDDDKFKDLDSYQKVWLDEGLKEERKNSKWAMTIGIMFAHWVINSYDNMKQEDKVPLSDAEMGYMRNRMVDVLKEEVRYSL